MSQRSTLNDEAIIHQLKIDTDPALLNELMERHQANVIRRCRGYVKDHNDAQDVSQEVFLRVLLNLSKFEEKSTFSAWLHQIVHNRCMDHIRQNKTVLNREVVEHIAEPWQEEDADVAEAPTVEDLEELMEQISGEEKYLLLLKYKEGWSLKQIQQAIGLPESLIKNRLYRTKQKLQRLLSDKLSK